METGGVRLGVHVAPHGARWAVRLSGRDRAERVLKSQLKAVAYAITRHPDKSIYVHHPNGGLFEILRPPHGDYT